MILRIVMISALIAFLVACTNNQKFDPLTYVEGDWFHELIVQGERHGTTLVRVESVTIYGESQKHGKSVSFRSSRTIPSGLFMTEDESYLLRLQDIGEGQWVFDFLASGREWSIRQLPLSYSPNLQFKGSGEVTEGRRRVPVKVEINLVPEEKNHEWTVIFGPVDNEVERWPARIYQFKFSKQAF